MNHPSIIINGQARGTDEAIALFTASVRAFAETVAHVHVTCSGRAEGEHDRRLEELRALAQSIRARIASEHLERVARGEAAVADAEASGGVVAVGWDPTRPRAVMRRSARSIRLTLEALIAVSCVQLEQIALSYGHAYSLRALMLGPRFDDDASEAAS